MPPQPGVQLLEISTPILMRFGSGGISNMEDIKLLCSVADEGIEGAITGRAIYEGALDYREAQQLADSLCKN